MNQPLKQRIIGAIVLISLAVIFIPALLDGSHKSISPLQQRQTPQKPNFIFEEIKLPSSIDSGRAPSRIIESKRDTSPSRPLEKPRKSRVKQVEKADSTTAKGTIAPEKTGDVSLPPSAWVVQIASLTNSKRALELREKLKKQGFAAFVEEIKQNGKKFYRIRVGPELERSEADVLQQQIKKKMKLEGSKVMRYQPL